jgi:hypothetical protein
MIINNNLPLESYNEQLKTYIFYASGKRIRYWGLFLCNFENNELNYNEINITLYKKTETLNFDKFKFLYNVDGEFCCIARMIGNSLEIKLHINIFFYF